MNATTDHHRLRWGVIYREVELYKSAVRLYTKPLFNPRKALGFSTDQRTLFDFARSGLKNLDLLHRSLSQQRFHFREALAIKRNFNGKERVLFVQPWEERLVSLLLYRLLNRAIDHQFSGSSYAYRWVGFGVDRCQRDIALTLKTLSAPIYVLKRDINNFFASIDHAILLDKLKRLIDPNDYLFELVADCVKFRYRDETTRSTAVCGVPFGTAVACVFANIYLMDLDRRLTAIPRIKFFRYADDLLVLSPEREAWRQAALVIANELAAIGLTSKRTHESDFLLSALPQKSPERTPHPIPVPSRRGDFWGRRPGEGWPVNCETKLILSVADTSDTECPAQKQFRHLGLEYRADGSVGLSRDKARKIRNLFRFAFRKHQRRFRRISSPERRAMLAVEIAQATLANGIRNVAIVDYYLRHVTDERQVRALDQWLAEEVLSIAFQGGHKKGYFRLLPFRRIRQMGLPSLVHRRRLILHRQIESPFFVWREHRASQGRGGWPPSRTQH